jgi:hypothetical protein
MTRDVPDLPAYLDDVERYYEELFESGRDLEELVRVNAHVEKPVGSAYLTRYTHDEITLVREAAAKRNMTEIDFIRAAALAAAAGELDLAAAGDASKWLKVRKIARDLNDAVSPQAEEKKPARSRKKAS